ncbi:MAG: PIN domain-containing protein [Deltaproteobacteria bacterium]|nr:PIN domain-containing protein [Deltaproteobacteria bacterium]MBW2119864.1 PIN domain-containing protein [Deltaproteobacteria bacterium]
MDYLADTVTIIRHFSKAGKIGRQARNILEGIEMGDHHMFLSIISLVEILYLSEKKRITINLEESLDMIDVSANYSIVDLTPDIVKLAEKIDFPEIFDRLIISTAKYLNAPILTSDRAIRSSGFVEAVWS